MEGLAVGANERRGIQRNWTRPRNQLSKIGKRKTRTRELDSSTERERKAETEGKRDGKRKRAKRDKEHGREGKRHASLFPSRPWKIK